MLGDFLVVLDKGVDKWEEAKNVSKDFEYLNSASEIIVTCLKMTIWQVDIFTEDYEAFCKLFDFFS